MPERRTHTPSAASRANSVPARSSLLMPSNIEGADQSAAYVAIAFANPHTNGLPLWGPSGQGVTVIRRYKPVAQEGYYACIWYTDDSSFEDSKTGGKGYWGFHPYPTPPATNQGTTHVWEVATGDGGDFYNNGSVVTIPVVYNEWRLQALQIVRNGASSKTFTFYTALPSTDPDDVITFTITDSNYGENNPPQVNPQITIGDSPWFGTYQHERASGYLGEHKIIAKALSEADILSESANMNQLVTADAIANIWWGKKGFISLDDLTCDYGTGRAFSWVSATKATLGSL